MTAPPSDAENASDAGACGASAWIAGFGVSPGGQERPLRGSLTSVHEPLAVNGPTIPGRGLDT